MPTLRPVPAQTKQRLEPALWKGKIVLCDLDETLIRTEKQLERGRIVLRSVNKSAIETFRELTSIGARIAITTTATRRYAERMTCAAGLLDVSDMLFPYEDLRYNLNGVIRVVPKNYNPAIKASFEMSPLDNCIAIGNNPEWDVPISPMGMVCAICTCETDFNAMFHFLEGIIRLGRGSFADGFDRLQKENGHADFPELDIVHENDREFVKGIVSGPARIAFFENEQISGVRKLLNS